MKKVDEILLYLDELLPNPKCALNFSSTYELLIAVVLSAQCTDERVNKVTKVLFDKAKTPEQMLELGENQIKQIIFPCGFYNNKTKAIINISKDLINKFNSQVPNTVEELTTLTGVGRKTANVVIGQAFGGQTIAVDTHVHRISKRLGLTKNNSTAQACEQDLIKVIPTSRHTKFHNQAVWFGRIYCKSRNPQCENCKLTHICKYKRK